MPSDAIWGLRMPLICPIPIPCERLESGCFAALTGAIPARIIPCFAARKNVLHMKGPGKGKAFK